MNLPVFRYHPDPVASGSIVASDRTCACCGEIRGFVYSGPAYCEADLDESICPWCIADGSAAHRFDATFVDENGISGEVPETSIEEISTRTPGYSSWQSEVWPACCGDAAAFLGPAGIAEIRKNYYTLEGDLMGYVVHDLGISGGAAKRFLESLHRDAGPTVYLFRCLHCERHLFHVDQH